MKTDFKARVCALDIFGNVLARKLTTATQTPLVGC